MEDNLKEVEEAKAEITMEDKIKGYVTTNS